VSKVSEVDIEQQELIQKLETQDDKMNDIYKVVLTAISFALAMYFGWYMSQSTSRILPLLSCIVLTLCPLFIIGTSYERVQTPQYQYAFGSLILVSFAPYLMSGLELFWLIPALVQLLNLMVIRDMYIVKRDLKSLGTKKYKFKGV
jgi:hypothetical protein